MWWYGNIRHVCKIQFVDNEDEKSEKVDFGKEEMNEVFDELNTAEKGDVIITLGSPQLGLEELSDLSKMLKGKSFEKTLHDFLLKSSTRTSTYS